MPNTPSSTIAYLTISRVRHAGSRSGSICPPTAASSCSMGCPSRAFPCCIGRVSRLAELDALVAPSRYKSEAWRCAARASPASRAPLRPQARRRDGSFALAEGLYIKLEERGAGQRSFKWVRASFLTSVMESGEPLAGATHRPNGLAEGVDLYAGARMTLLDRCPSRPAFALDWDGLSRAMAGWRRCTNASKKPSLSRGGQRRHPYRDGARSAARHAAWRALQREDQETCFLAALLHDVAKPSARAASRMEG